MSEGTFRGSPIRLAVLLTLHAACGVAILGLLLKLVPQYEKIFKDFGVKVPDITTLVIDLSRCCTGYWLILIPCLGAADVAIMLSLNRAGHTRLMTTWGILLWLAQMLLMGLIVAAIMFPMNNLLIDLSK